MYCNPTTKEQETAKFFLTRMFPLAIVNWQVYRLKPRSLRGVAQFGRAPGLGPGGRKFESCHLDFAGVAGKTRLRDAGAVPLFFIL